MYSPKVRVACGSFRAGLQELCCVENLILSGKASGVGTTSIADKRRLRAREGPDLHKYRFKHLFVAGNV